MATDRSNTDKNNEGRSNQDKGDGSSGGSSMKERLLAQRRAAAEAEAAAGSSPATPPVPATRPRNPAPGVVPTTPPIAGQGTGQSGATARAQAAAAAAAAARAIPAAAPAPAPAARPSASAASRRPVQLSGAREEERAAKRERRGANPEVLKEVEMLRKQQDKWITYGWIVAGALLAIALVTYFVVKGKHDAVKQAEVDRRAAIVAFIQKIEAYDLKTPAGIEGVIKDTEDPKNADLWNHEIEGAYSRVFARKGTAVREKQRQKELAELLEGITDLEALCSNANTRSSDDLAKARRRVTEYENQAAEFDEAFKLRVKRVRTCVDKAYVVKLHEEAKALVGKGPAEARNALTALTKAEDEVTRQLEDAARNKLPQETVEMFNTELRAIVDESDALVAQIFTPDVIEKTPWTDLLAEGQKTNWQNVGFKGWQIKDGVLQGVGPDLDAKLTAIMSVNDQLPMRDYLFECDFVLVKGEATFMFRLGKATNNAMSMPVSTVGKEPFKAGDSNAMTASMLGSAFKMAFADEAHGYEEPAMRLSVRRKGAIGISVPPGSEIKITKMRVKILR